MEGLCILQEDKYFEIRRVQIYACLLYIISTWYQSCVIDFLHGMRAGIFGRASLQRISKFFGEIFSEKNNIIGFLAKKYPN